LALGLQPVDLHRNGWTVISGTGGRFPPERVDGFDRNAWSNPSGIRSVRIPAKSTTGSGSNRPLIPIEIDRSFRRNPTG